MGFPLTQREWMEKQGDASFDPAIFSGLDLCHVTVAPPYAKKMAEIKGEFGWFLGILAQYPGTFMVKSKGDMKCGGLKIVGGLQHPPEIRVDENIAESPVESLVRNFSYLKGEGIILTTLAYEEASIYGGGFASPEVSLTETGRSLLIAMAYAGMVLDLSHAGEQTIVDALDIIEHRKLPLGVVASHVGCRSVYDHPRNLSDDVLGRIVDLGGVIGITTTTFLNDAVDDSAESFYRQVEYALNLLGENAVCIGTDGIYKKQNPEEQKKLFETMKQKIDPRGNFRARFPDQPEELNTPVKMIVLAREIQQRFGQDIASKIAGDNFFNFISRIL